MKITKRQLKRIIRESGRDWDLEDNVSYFIAAGPPEKAIKYLEKLVAHAEAGGEVGWRDAMNSHDPEIANFEYAKKRLEALKSGADGAIGHSRLPENAISKRQLRRIIKEEKRQLLSEGAYIHDIFAKATSALESRDGRQLEDLARQVNDLMLPDRERYAYSQAIYAMAEAAYELESYEDEGY